MTRRKRVKASSELDPWIVRAASNLGLPSDQAQSARFFRRALADEIVRLVIQDRAELSDQAREELGSLEGE